MLGQSFILNNLLRFIELSFWVLNFVFRLRYQPFGFLFCMGMGANNVLARAEVPSPDHAGIGGMAFSSRCRRKEGRRHERSSE